MEAAGCDMWALGAIAGCVLANGRVGPEDGGRGEVGPGLLMGERAHLENYAEDGAIK